MEKQFKLLIIMSLMIMITLLLSACVKEEKNTGEKPNEIENNQADEGDNGILPDEVGDKTINTWGIQLDATKVTSKGMKLVCKQSGGEPTGDLHIGTYYFIEKQIDEQWVAVETLLPEDGIGWEDIAWNIPMNDSVEWDINWEWLYGDLTDGDYRIGKEITDFRKTGDYDTKIYYANFEVTN